MMKNMSEEISVVGFDEKDIKPVPRLFTKFYIPFILSHEPDEMWKAELNTIKKNDKYAKLLKGSLTEGKYFTLIFDGPEEPQKVADALELVIADVNASYKKNQEFRAEVSKEMQRKKEETEKNRLEIEEKFKNVKF